MSVVVDCGAYESSCGYCHSVDGFVHSLSLHAYSLTVQDYQDLLDRGWRRSGRFLYRPNNAECCCPMYTIRLPAERFEPNSAQRRKRRRVMRYLEGSYELDCGGVSSSSHEMSLSPIEVEVREVFQARVEALCRDFSVSAMRTPIVKVTRCKRSAHGDLSCPTAHAVLALLRRSGNTESELTLEELARRLAESPVAPFPSSSVERVDVCGGFVNVFLRDEARHKVQEWTKEHMVHKPAPPSSARIHNLEVSFRPSDFTEETFEVFRKYQMAIHHDEATRTGFQRFLCDTPLEITHEEGAPPCGYGSFHMLYRIDGRLAMVAVLDVLPLCLSSVYLFYDPEFAFLSPGVWSALEEIDWVQHEIHRNPATTLRYYYMGYYIHTCPKMRYKGDYAPSDLLCPVSLHWVPLSLCGPLLNTSKFSRFAPIEAGDDETEQVERMREDLPHIVVQVVKRGRPISQAEGLRRLERFHRHVGSVLARRMVLVVK